MDLFHYVQKMLTITQNYEYVNHSVNSYIVNFSIMTGPLLHPGNVSQHASIHRRATGLGDMDK